MVRTVQLKSDQRLNVGSAVGAAVGYGAARKVDGDYRNAARVAGGVIGGAPEPPFKRASAAAVQWRFMYASCPIAASASWR